MPVGTTILPVASTPSTYAAGSWPLATLQGGPAWGFTIIPSQASGNAAYLGYCALVVSTDDGGCYMVNRRVELYNGAGGGTLVGAGNTLTWNAGQAIRVEVRLAAGAGASSITVSGALTGNGTTTFTSSGTYYTNTTLGIGVHPGGGFGWTGTVSSLDDATVAAAVTTSTSPPSASTAASASTSAAVTASAPAPTATTAATSPGSSSVTTSRPAPLISSSTQSSGTSAVAAAAPAPVASTAAAGPSSFTVGTGAAAQSVNSSQPPTGTASTHFPARAASTAYAQNAAFTANGTRWRVTVGGTTGAGAGPSGSGVQTDGTATVVAVRGAVPSQVDTNPANNVILAVLARGQSASDTSGPSGNKGETFARQGPAHPYAAFPTSATELWAAVNAPGGADHRWSATWGNIGSAGDEISLVVLPILTGKATCRIQDLSHVERTSPTGGVVVSAPVTTTGPAKLVSIWCGSGTVITPGTAHLASPQAPFTASSEADTTVALSSNGYIQLRAAVAEVLDPGTYTATWSSNEGAQLFLVAVQDAEGSAAAGSSAVPAPSASTATSTTAVVVSAISSTLAAPSAATAAVPSTTSAVTATAPAPAAASSTQSSGTSAVAASAPAPAAASSAASQGSATAAVAASVAAPAASTSAAAPVAPGTSAVAAAAPAPAASSSTQSASSSSVAATAPAPSASTAAGSANDFWTVVRARCPEARGLSPTMMLLVEQLLQRWLPPDAPYLAGVYLARHVAAVLAQGARGTLGTVTSQSLAASEGFSAGAFKIDGTWGLSAWGALYLGLVAVPGPGVL